MSADFLKETLRARKDWQDIFRLETDIQSDEKQGPITKITLFSKAII